MATTTKPVILDETGRAIAAAIEKVAGAIEKPKVYSFHIDATEADPKAAVTYLEDAVGMMPAYMDYTNDVFNYGSWSDAFFMPRPVMLKSDGTVGYYLNPSDYSKKMDGTASDVANASYDGNAMMEWGRDGKKIWYKIVPDSDNKSASIYIADSQVDSNYVDWNFHNSEGKSVDHFYTPIYNGSLVDNKMRSLSGRTASKSLTAPAERAAAKLNNLSGADIWDIEVYVDRLLINYLLILMGKSLDTQTVFGQGLTASGSETINDNFSTGVHNKRGLFYGKNNGAAATYTNAVKVFGMENYWGFQWRREAGYINANGAQKIKLTYGTEDGSEVEGYNADGSGYINTGVTSPAASGTYVNQMTFTKDGMFPLAAAGSASTYYCDGLWTNNTIYAFARAGGYSHDSALCGAFYLALNVAASYANWNAGAALSCKPLA